MAIKISLSGLKDEINNIRKDHPTFKDDAAFVFWFVLAYLVGIDNEQLARSSLTGKEGGRGGEKNIDAIYIDEKNKQCSIVQGKFHTLEGFAEKINDVLSFAGLGLLPWESKSLLETFYSKLDPIVLEKFRELVGCVKNKKYKLNLYYVTTGKCTDTIINQARVIVRQAGGPVNIRVVTLKDILNIFRDYLEIVTPHIPPLKLRVISEGVIQHEGVMHRFDPRTNIESWALSVCGYDVGEMYNRVGRRLFAKNIRGWLGHDTDINKSMAETIKKEPDNFWYYNNGVTIVCTNAEKTQSRGEDFIIIEGAQVINGQQTTITLSNSPSKDTNVLVKIIKIPRDYNNGDGYDKLVNSIVRATNWQNYIVPSDLVSNDYIQIFLEKELRKNGYQYIRKRMTKTEARSLFGQGYYQIDKREAAQAVAACLFDPVIVRKGKENLFEDPYYKSIFSSRQISFYLSKYWLMKLVQFAARGYPERAYAKWLVINFIWKNIHKDIESGYPEKKFRYACERGWRNEEEYWNTIIRPLNNAIVNVFRAALKFYRLNRGEGEEAKDISTFFLLSKLDVDFKKFWPSKRNSYRDEFNRNVKRFKKKFRELDIN